MAKESYKKFSRQSKITMGIYFAILLFIFGFAAYQARHVMFQQFWSARKWTAAVSVDQTIYLFGGRAENNALCNDVLRIDLAKKTLRKVAELPAPRFDAHSFYINNRIYIIGGYTGTQYADDILEFDPATNAIREIAKLPAPRAFGGAIQVAGKIYYVGGWDGKTFATDIFQFDPQTGQVSVTGQLAEPREYFAAVGLADKMYIFGGENNEWQSVSDIFELDPVTGTILRTAQLPSPRISMSATALGNKIYALGGWNKRDLDEFLEIDPAGDDITVTMIGLLPQGQAGVDVVPVGKELYMIAEIIESSERQIALFRIRPDTADIVRIRLRSYSWWPK